MAGPDVAAEFLSSLERAGAQLWHGGPEIGGLVLSAARKYRIRGRRIYDLAIGAAALLHGASEIWTHDPHFAALPPLRIFDPLADAD